MLTRPTFKACYHVEALDPHYVFLITEDKHWLLNGPIYKALAPLLDGAHSLNDIVAHLEGRFAIPELFRALTRMEEKGYIVEADLATPPELLAFWHALGLSSAEATRRLEEARVVVTAVGDVDAAPLIAALDRAGIQRANEGRLQLVVTSDYLQPDLAAINQHALASEQSWMLVRPQGSQLWVGPIFQPGKTACWECMADRIRTNRQLDAFILRNTGQQEPLDRALPALASTVEIAANLAATEVVKWLLPGRNQRLEGQLLTLDLATLEGQNHVVVRRPQCPACGTPHDDQVPEPLQLTSRKKRYRSDGGHRTILPEQTFARYKHHISPITGVINWLTDITGAVNGLAYSYAAGHNFALVQNSVYWLRQNLRSRTGGKGMTEIQAKVSAMCEAVERYSGVFRGEGEITRRSSYRALGEQAVHVGECLLFSDAQYENRRAWNAQLQTPFHLVTKRFDEEAEMDWTPLWSLTSERFRYLPTSYCYFGHPELNLEFCGSDGNGCAAGNTKEEAILQGFLELVERDSVALWWYNRVRRPRVDLASFGLPYLEALREYYQTLNREFWVLDITSDLTVPTFAAISRRTDRPVEDIILGFGSHLDPQIALLRAITELNQFLPSVSHAAPDGSTIYHFPDKDALTWWQKATIDEEFYLVPDASVAPRTLGDYTRLDSDDLLDDVTTCVEIARSVGLEMLVLDQTKADIGLPVCRVIVPGLRHFWRRLGPGRLYDVPVKLGWLDTPTPEDEMNPHSIFF